jgi:hypothetical protein
MKNYLMTKMKKSKPEEIVLGCTDYTRDQIMTGDVPFAVGDTAEAFANKIKYYEGKDYVVEFRSGMLNFLLYTGQYRVVAVKSREKELERTIDALNAGLSLCGKRAEDAEKALDIIGGLNVKLVKEAKESDEKAEEYKKELLNALKILNGFHGRGVEGTVERWKKVLNINS